MDIKYSAPLPALTPTAPNPTPCSASTLKAADPNEQVVAAMVPADASHVHDSMVLAAAATSQTCPVRPEQLGANQVLDSASDDKEEVQVKNELPDQLARKICTTQATHLSSEQQKRRKVHGDSYIVDNPLGSATNVGVVEKMCVIKDELLQVGLLQGTLGESSFFCRRDKQIIRQTYLVPSVQDFCVKSHDTFAANGWSYQAHALVHFSDALGARACDIGCQVEWLICSMGKLNHITDRSSFGAKTGRILSAVLLEQWDPGINLGCWCVLLSHSFMAYFTATVPQLRHCRMFFSLPGQWKFSTGIWYLDDLIIGAKEWVLQIYSRNELMENCSISCILILLWTLPQLPRDTVVVVQENKQQICTHPCMCYKVNLNSSTQVLFYSVELLKDFKSTCVRKTWELAGAEHLRDKYIDHHENDIVLLVDHEQQINVLVVHQLLLPFQQLQGIDLLTVHELQGVIWKYQIDQWDSFFQEQMVHKNRRTDSGCYCHLQSKLFRFTIYRLCHISTPDGMPWDPGGVIESRIQAIAWGQAMFCRGGSVTPDVHLDWAFVAGGSKRAWPSWSTLGARLIKDTGGHGRRHRRIETESHPTYSFVYLLPYLAS